MKTRSRNARQPFELKLVAYGNCYYIDRVARLERALARRPRTFQIDLIGAGEIPADAALLIRSVLIARSPRTHLITRARSSLQNGSVLVWLLGDTRLIRDDARLFFRRATLSEDDDAKQEDEWYDEPEFCDSFSEIDPEEGDHALATVWRVTVQSWLVRQGLISVGHQPKPNQIVSTTFPKKWSHN